MAAYFFFPSSNMNSSNSLTIPKRWVRAQSTLQKYNGSLPFDISWYCFASVIGTELGQDTRAHLTIVSFAILNLSLDRFDLLGSDEKIA